MTLKFPVELIINGDEWKIQPFRFNVHAINTGSYTPSYRDVTVTGVSPLNLPNAQANGLRYIKLFGKAEILNLIDKSTITPNCYLASGGTIVTNNKNLDISDYIEVSPSYTYKYTAVNYGTTPRMVYYDANKDYISDISMASAQNFTPVAGTKYVRLSIYKTSLDIATLCQLPTPSAPVPVMCNNGAVSSTWLYPNIFDKTTATLDYYINANGGEQYNTSWACSDYIEVVEGGVYNLRGVSSYGAAPRTGFYKADQSFDSAISQSANNFTIPTGIKYIRVSIYKSSLDTAQVSQVMTPIIETVSLNGNTATAQALLSCGDNVDEQNVTTGAITRKVGYLTLTGTENWGIQDGYSDIFYWRTGKNAVSPNTCICSHFIAKSSSAGIGTLADGEIKYGYNAQPDRIYIKYSAYDNDLAGFKSWLETQYTAGAPVTVVFALETETTETVTAQDSLQTIAGDNTITITQAAVQYLKLEVTYSAGVEVTIEEVEAANVDQQVEVTIGE